MKQQTKQVQENSNLEPTVTNEELKIASRYSDLVEEYDLLRNRFDIRYRGSHELTYTQRKQLERVRKYEQELRRKYTK